MKKLLKHLKENWIRHGFETFAILIGVLAAFSLSNWNEGRNAKKQERIVLQQLLDEFHYNKIKLGSYLIPGSQKSTDRSSV
jgi:hypothetical protein